MNQKKLIPLLAITLALSIPATANAKAPCNSSKPAKDSQTPVMSTTTAVRRSNVFDTASWAFFHNHTSETWQRLNRDHIKTKGAETMCTFVLDHPNHDACNDDDCGQQHEICSTCNRRRHVDDPAA
jgi:hypothetical protein